MFCDEFYANMVTFFQLKKGIPACKQAVRAVPVFRAINNFDLFRQKCAQKPVRKLRVPVVFLIYD